MNIKNSSIDSIEKNINLDTMFKDDSGFGFEEGINRNVSLRRVGIGIGFAAVSAAVIAGTAIANDGGPGEINQKTTVNSSTAENSTDDASAKRQIARCERQTELDPTSYNSCQYKGAYAAISKKHPAWVRKQKLSAPGADDKADRKQLYFKTHPKVYKRLQLENQAGANYISPNFKLWEDGVNNNECTDTWDCNTGNGYYGGLQMDVDFQETYNATAVKIWGLASNWPRSAQMLAADRAYNGYNGHAARGLGPWPTSNAEFGTFPVPLRKVVVPRLVFN